MVKAFVIFLLGLMIWFDATAQTDKDTVNWYIKIPNTVVDNIKDADYVQISMPPDSSSGTKLYSVVQYYMNGKRRLIGNSLTRGVVPKLEGSAIDFFPNGNKKRISTYREGKVVGDAVDYFPNGKIYEVLKFDPTIQFIECRDSIGHVLAEKGNGLWEYYDENFNDIIGINIIKRGVSTDDAHYIPPMGEDIEHKGKAYKPLDTAPSYKGKIKAFNEFVKENIQYPEIDKQKNIKGKVYLNFIVEKDGTLTTVKVIHSISKTIDAEAIRILKLSSPWIPGSVNNAPVRTRFNVPIYFPITSN
jgi:TonB family protein